MTTESRFSAVHVALDQGIAKGTVYRWRKKCGVPVHYIGWLWKNKLSEIDEWVWMRHTQEILIHS